jgi:FkbH-like protein
MNLQISEALEITVAANFWVGGIREPLEFWLRELGVSGRVDFAPFDQPIQYLLAPVEDRGSTSRLSVILLQLERWARDRSQLEETELARNAADLFAALQQGAMAAGGRRYLVLFCPATPSRASVTALRNVEKTFADRCAAELPEIDVVTSEELARLYPPKDYAAYFDPYAEKLSQNPYSRLCLATLATMVVRRLYIRYAPPRKVIVVDCDNTLWSGVCGEAGAIGVEIGPARRALQQFLMRQVERGWLLCLSSKNEERDVIEVFTRNPGMLLQMEHLTAWKVNWQAKRDNLRALSVELGLHLDSFIFLDDDPFECNQAMTMCPEVLTIQIPWEESRIEAALLNIWEFDQRISTGDDRQRTAYYRQNAERSRAREQTASLEEFLRSLELEVEFEPIRSETIARACQLTERTNQFNLNGIRRSAGELRALMNDRSRTCQLVSARDRFGDYGIVGLSVARVLGERFQVETLLLSCRALGRGIETRLMENLAATARALGVTEVEFDYRSTAKNGPLQTFLGGIGISGQSNSLGVSALSAAFPPQTLGVCSMQVTA